MKKLINIFMLLALGVSGTASADEWSGAGINYQINGVTCSRYPDFNSEALSCLKSALSSGGLSYVVKVNAYEKSNTIGESFAFDMTWMFSDRMNLLEGADIGDFSKRDKRLIYNVTPENAKELLFVSVNKMHALLEDYDGRTQIFRAKYPDAVMKEFLRAIHDKDYVVLNKRRGDIEAFVSEWQAMSDLDFENSKKQDYVYVFEKKNLAAIESIVGAMSKDVSMLKMAINKNEISAEDANDTLSHLEDNIQRLEGLKDGINADADKELSYIKDVMADAQQVNYYCEDARILIERSKALGPLVEYSRKIKAKGWANGLSVLAKSNYFSKEYQGYLFRVDESDDYSVAQSSGNLVRMESSSGPVLIVDFKNFPPPTEGATLEGRYLVLVKTGSYKTGAGGVRNAYFFKVAQ